VLITARQVLALQKEHERQNFTCGSPALDRYLKNQARQDSDKRVAAVFALVQPPASQVLGYYTLSASTIHADEVPPEFARKLPRYPQLPVTLLGRLAIDQGLKGQGMGQWIRSAVLASEKSLAAYLRPQYQGTHIPNSCGFGLRTQVGSMSTRSCNL
jgi:hypothetical protein